MTFDLIRFMVRDAGTLRFAIVIVVASLFALSEALFLKEYFTIAPIVTGADYSGTVAEVLLRSFLFLGGLYVLRFALALISNFLMIRYVYEYARKLTMHAVNVSLVKGIWKKPDDRAKIFISPEIIATKCLKGSLTVVLECFTIVGLSIVIVLQLKSLLLIFLAIMAVFLIIVFYLPNILLKKQGVLRDKADSKMQKRSASVLEAPLDYISADSLQYALGLVSTSVADKYSSIKNYNFISGISRYTLEFAFLASALITSIIAFFYLGIPQDKIIVAITGLVVGGLRIVPSTARLMQAWLDLSFGAPALQHSFSENLTASKSININNLSDDFKTRLVEVNAGKMLDFSDGLTQKVTLNLGDICVITGEIGAGKSLFLKLLSNHGSESDISLTIRGEMLTEPKVVKDYFPIYVGASTFLIEGPLSENVYLCPSKEISSEQQSKLQQLLEELSLQHTDLGNHPDLVEANLSTGNRQIVGILRALMSDHRVILFDEPTSALDPNLETRVCSIISELDKDKVIFIVTHRDAPIGLATVRMEIKKPGKFNIWDPRITVQ
jgi:ABC-type lipoprotein export system ATPase subunit